MRLWSIHPKYLDWMGLGALWRESLLAREVLKGKTKGWKQHPQLNRFKTHENPLKAIEYYLLKVHEEATLRGYHYDSTKILVKPFYVNKIPITSGQLDFELELFMNRSKKRTPSWFQKLVESNIVRPDPHPIFTVEKGNPGSWEVSYWRYKEGLPIGANFSEHHRATAKSLASS